MSTTFIQKDFNLKSSFVDEESSEFSSACLVFNNFACGEE